MPILSHINKGTIYLQIADARKSLINIKFELVRPSCYFDILRKISSLYANKISMHKFMYKLSYDKSFEHWRSSIIWGYEDQNKFLISKKRLKANVIDFSMIKVARKSFISVQIDVENDKPKVVN